MRTIPLSRIVKQVTTAWFCLLLFGGICTQAYAATSEDIRFEDQVAVGGQQLALHGIGLLKWKYLIKVYLVALYKPSGVAIGQVLTDIPKRLEYYFFVDMKASDFQDTGFQLMAQNIGEKKARALAPELAALNRLYRDVKAGQRYTLTYIPDKGTEMALDGESLGVVPGAEFAAAYFSIWLGPDPVSRSLQKGMFEPITKRP